MSFSLSKWLEQIDPSMKEYAAKLENFGFGSLKTLRNIDNDDIYQLLDEVEQNIVICRWRADQLFADAEGRGK